VEGVARTTVGFAGNDDARAASLLAVVDRLRCMYAGLFLGCKVGIFLHVLECRKLLVEDIWYRSLRDCDIWEDKYYGSMSRCNARCRDQV
jgi:hypothetical protein